jgi:Rod binding domain-containing protein
MEITSTLGPVRAEKLSLEQLASNKGLSEQAKTAEASRQFEAMLLRQILVSANKPVFPSEYAPKSLAGDIYRDMISEQLADRISSARQFGLSGMLEKQLSPAPPKTAAAGTQAAPPLSAVPEAKLNGR